MIGEMVRNMGHLAVVCDKPTDALRLFSKAPDRFDSVMLDEIMPDLRGTQLAMRLIGIKEDIPIILITGSGDKISLEQIRESGVRAALIKPVERGWLQIALARLVE